jgi:hypothetical protein
MEPVEGPGALTHQVVAAVRQQPQDDRVVLEADLAKARGPNGGHGDRDGVVGVALAAVAGRQQPHPGGQLGGHVNDRFTLADQLLGEPAAKAAGAFHRPAPLGPALGPATQRTPARPGAGKSLLVNRFAALIQHGSGAAGLVGIDPDDHTHPATSLVDPILRQGGQPDLEQCSPLTY